MQRNIRIERLPKLDKVLRVTFTTIKRDLSQTQEEFLQLEEKVNDSLDFYSKRLKESSDSTWAKITNKAKEVEDEFSKKTKAFEKDLKQLTKRVDDLIKNTNKKITGWNKKIERIDENALKAKEMGKELKTLRFMRTELEKVKVIDSKVESVDQLKVDNNEFESVKKDLYKQINDEAGSFATSLALSEKSTKKDLSNLKKDLKTNLGHLDSKFDDLKKHTMDALTELNKQVNDKTQVAKVTEELINIKLEILREFNTIKDNYQKEIREKQDKLDMRVLKQEIIAEVKKEIGKDFVKAQKVVETKPAKKMPVKKEKGIFTRFIDFLVEDVDDDKDATIQEFDRKKNGKFEIKEIRNLKE